MLRSLLAGGVAHSEKMVISYFFSHMVEFAYTVSLHLESDSTVGDCSSAQRTNESLVLWVSAGLSSSKPKSGFVHPCAHVVGTKPIHRQFHKMIYSKYSHF